VIPVTEYLSLSAGSTGSYIETKESDELLSEIFKNITDSDYVLGYVYLNDLQRFKYTITDSAKDSQDAAN